MGGRIAINFTLTYPGMVRSLTVMDTALDGYKNTVDWNVRASEVGIEGAKKNWLRHDVFAQTNKSLHAMRALKPIIKDYSGWHWLHKDIQNPATYEALSRLHEIVTPTLILVGEKDLSYFHDIATVVKSGVVRSQKIVIPGSGHMINLEKPKIVNELLAGFIA